MSFNTKFLFRQKIRPPTKVNNLVPEKPTKKPASKKKRNIKFWFGVVFAIGVWGGCIYIILVVAANSTYEESKTWSKNFLITLNQDLFVTPLIKVILTIVVLTKIRKIKSKLWFKIATKLADPLTTRALTILTIKPMSLQEMMKQKALQEAKYKEENPEPPQPDEEKNPEDLDKRNLAEIQIELDKSVNQSRDEFLPPRVVDPNLNRNTRMRRQTRHLRALGEATRIVVSPVQQPLESLRNFADNNSNSSPDSPDLFTNTLENTSLMKLDSAKKRTPRINANDSPSPERRPNYLDINASSVNLKSERDSKRKPRTLVNEFTENKNTNFIASNTLFEIPDLGKQQGERSQRQKSKSPERSQNLKKSQGDQLSQIVPQSSFERAGNVVEEKKSTAFDGKEKLQPPKQNNFMQSSTNLKNPESIFRSPREPEQSFRAKNSERGGLIPNNANDRDSSALVGSDLRRVKMEAKKTGKTRRYNI